MSVHPPEIEVLDIKVVYDCRRKISRVRVEAHEGAVLILRISPKLSRETALGLCGCFANAIGIEPRYSPCIAVAARKL